jgi:elongation factor 1-beta
MKPAFVRVLHGEVKPPATFFFVSELASDFENRSHSLEPKAIAKSMVIFDVKPWDDETDMKALEEAVLSIEMEGLVWGTRKLVPVGYGIKKLSITAVIVDDLVSTDDLIDRMVEFEDYVQSVDIAAFNKL